MHKQMRETQTRSTCKSRKHIQILKNGERICKFSKLANAGNTGKCRKCVNERNTCECRKQIKCRNTDKCRKIVQIQTIHANEGKLQIRKHIQIQMKVICAPNNYTSGNTRKKVVRNVSDTCL